MVREPVKPDCVCGHSLRAHLVHAVSIDRLVVQTRCTQCDCRHYSPHVKFYKVERDSILEFKHSMDGGDKLGRIFTLLPHNEELRVVYGLEPAGKNKRLLWHVSAAVSHRGSEAGTKRRATDDEMDLVETQFPGIKFCKYTRPVPGCDPNVRHLWERDYS